MSLVENLVAAGYVPEKSTDGEWKPYTGTYGVTWVSLRKEVDEANGNAEYIQSEWDIDECLEGDPKRDSKFAPFSQRTYLQGDDANRVINNLKRLCNQAFTFGVDPNTAGSDEDLLASLQGVIQKKGYVRAWVWNSNKGPRQSFAVQKPEVAEKKRTGDSVPF